MEKKEQTIKGLTQLAGKAKEFLDALHPEEGRATIVGLSGDLGSGKTAFTKALATELSIFEEVPSPTFVIAKYYDIPGNARWKKLIHIDLYRIDDHSELTALRWEEIIADPKSLVVVEWPEKIGKQFREDAHLIQFIFIDESTRKVNIVR